jgi:hypothetical protein
MADVLHMPPRPIRKGRPRSQPVKGAPLAEVIDFHEANKPTYVEVKASVDKLAYHLLWAMRAAKEIFPAYE